MRWVTTTILELAGIGAIVAGVLLVAGLGFALVAGGAAALVVSWRVSSS